jgi:hypothetical protein
VGSFSQIDGLSAGRAARWDGRAWTPAGDGLAGSLTAAAAFDDGSGPALYVAGRRLKGQDQQYVARLDGSVWTVLDGIEGSWWHHLCVFDYVSSLVAYDDGTGPALYAAGQFEHVHGVPSLNIARWKDKGWEPNTGLGDCLGVFPLATSNGELIAWQSGMRVLYRWNGTGWPEVPNSWRGFPTDSFVAYDDGSGEALYAGVASGGDPYPGVARWDGMSWSGVGNGIRGPDVHVRAFQSFQGMLYAGGQFGTAGGEPALNIARWGCPPCPADCDGSGTLDLFDFLCFVNRYNAGDRFGDCTDEGAFDFFDFVCFISLFNEGC